MFTNIIGTLTSLLPKPFIFGSYVPILIFGFLNAVIAYLGITDFRAFVNDRTRGPSLAFDTAVLFAASVVIAYVLSSISDRLREILEGKYLPPVLADALRRAQQKRFDTANRKYFDVRQESIRTAILRTSWENHLDNATLDPAPRTQDLGVRRAAVTALADLFRMRNRGAVIPAASIAGAVGKMCSALRLFDIGEDVELGRCRDDLRDLIGYALSIAEVHERRRFNDRQVNFGEVPEPTRLGNVAASIANYTVTRYNIDLDTFWSRLQPVIQRNDDKSYNALADAKTQLDFLIACWWLASGTTLVWSVVLATIGEGARLSVVIVPAGLGLSYAAYSLAVTCYLSYGQIIRAAVDLNRITLLRNLHIARPSGIREERAAWIALQRVSGFGEHAVEFSYEYDEKQR